MSNFQDIKQLANEVNNLGKFDVIIHNAGVFSTSSEEIFEINVLAPFILTALINKPKKLIYISSTMQAKGKVDLENLLKN